MSNMPNPVLVALTIFCYLALLLWGASLIEARRAHVTLVATRELPANHLVQSGDLTLAVDARQYLPRKLHASEAVGLVELVTLPKAEDRPDRVSRTLAVLRADVESGAINSGAKLLICPPEGGSDAVSVEVRAALCGDVGPCFALVDVPAADAEGIRADVAELKSKCG